MYYLLTFKLSRAVKKLRKKSVRYANLSNEAEKELKQNVAENTYLLALDGDVDFEPQSVITLVHKMQVDPDTAAVCGRIHPRGFGETHKPLSLFCKSFGFLIRVTALSHWLSQSPNPTPVPRMVVR